MTDYVDYIDKNGNGLTLAEFRRILRKHSTAQYMWWRAKAQPRFGADRPPPGVRQHRRIKFL